RRLPRLRGTMADQTPDLTLAEARAIIDRAAEKARELHQAGAFVVMDAAGNPVSISCMQGGPTTAGWVTRAKAYVSAGSARAQSAAGRELAPQPCRFLGVSAPHARRHICWARRHADP